MPLWYRAEHAGQPGSPWRPRKIDASGLSLGEGRAGALAMGPEARPPIATLRAHEIRGSAVAVLVLGRSEVPVLVNGYPPLPVSVLADRCEVVLGRHILRYGAHQQPSVTEFSESDLESHCATCTRPLEIGDEILRCSSCQAPRHEGALAAGEEPALLCASYAPSCCRCGASPDDRLNAEFEAPAAGGGPPPLTQQGERHG